MERVDYESIVIQELLNFHKTGDLDIAPWYQRRSVWTRPQKSYLINTLFERKPVPTIYLRQFLDLEADKITKEVVDGQQRIRTILEYSNDEFAARHPAKDRLAKFSDLSNSQKSRFLTTKLSIGYLIDASDADVIDIFGRINSVAKTLNSQERRNALFSGEYKQFCLSQAATRVSLWRGLKIFSANQIARMDEVQFISDLCLNMLEGLSDFSQPKLTAFYKRYDEDFPERASVKNKLDRVFAAIAQVPITTITDTIFNRPPLLFSLLLVLDGQKAISTKSLKNGLLNIDRRFNTDTPLNERPRKDAEFLDAVRASTQRIKQRRIRQSYIKGFLKS